jgi:glycosyltransferase involved in cell wall biosynthesis
MEASSSGKPLRICLLGLHFAPMVGGAEQFAERKARQLQALGHHAMIVTLRHQRQWPRAEVRDGLPVLRIGGLYRRTGRLRIGRLAIWPIMPLVAYALWRHRAQYDAISVMQVSPLAVVAALIGQITQTPVVIRLQSIGSATERASAHDTGLARPSDAAQRRSYRDHLGGLEGLRKSVVGGPLLAEYLRRAPVTYQTVSRRGDAYLAAEGIPAERSIYIPTGVDIARFHPADGMPASPRPHLREIACVARFEHSKGIDVLLRAWSLLLRPDTSEAGSGRPRLLLIGDGLLRPQFEALAHQLSLDDSVVFMGHRDDIAETLQRCYAFVLPSRWEGLPNALLEAMACGLPCVATRVSGSEDVLTDGVNGLLVPPEQPIALSEALRRLLDDSDFAARLGSAARTTIEREYSLPTVVDQFIALYRRLTQQAGVPLERLVLARESRQ